MRQAISTADDVLTFGKYRGKTIKEVATLNPRYVEWLLDSEIVQIPESLCDELLKDWDDNPYDNDWQDGHPFDFGDN